jgi:Conserved TM helix
MSDLSRTLHTLQATLNDVYRAFIEYLPHFLAALLLLFAGWLVARLLRAACIRLASGLDNLLARLGRWSRAKRRLTLTGGARILIGNVVFWVVILLFVAMAARVARLELFTAWLDRLVAWLPTLLAGGLIVLAGWFVSTLVRDVVSAALASAGSAQSELFGRIAQGAVFLAGLVIGLDQVGIDITFLTILFAIVAAGLLLSVALAFGLGARDLVANLIGAQQLTRLLEPGQVARIDGIEGQVIELTPTAVILATGEGRLAIPARRFQETAVLMVTADEDG